MKNLVFLIMLVFLAACSSKNEAPTSTQPEAVSTTPAPGLTPNLKAYELEAVPGTNWQKAIKRDSAGHLLEVGYFENGKKVGSWALYEHAPKDFINKLATYKDGKLNGVYMELNGGGQTEMIAYYQDDQLHGYWGKFRFARVLEEANYKNGKLDGVYALYSLQDGRLQTTAEYKNGVQDGYYRTYNTDGVMTTEYLYKNGEKISGGAVNSK